MPKLNLELHKLACIHEAAHAIMLNLMGFHVIKAVALMPEARARRDVGETVYHLTPSDDPLDIERLAIGICAGYVAELLYHYGVERFDGEDVIQLCNRDGGYEAGYAHHICEHSTGDELFEQVILKTKHYLKTPSIVKAVQELADLLHRIGEVDHDRIINITYENGLRQLFVEERYS